MEFKERDYYDEIFENMDIKEKILESKEFDNCIFKKCILTEVVLKYCKFIECKFEKCDLSLLKIKNSIFNNVVIEDCKAIGVNWALCEKPFALNIYNSNISMSSFYGLNFIHSDIISCKAHEVDFSQTNLEKVNFKNTDLSGAVFSNTNLCYADLAMAINYSINPEINKIRKMKVSINEAISFLQFLDLDIIK